MVDLNRLTNRAQEAVLAAQQLAEKENHSQIEVEHLMYALLDQQDGVVPQILSKLGVAPSAVQAQLKAALDKLPKVYGAGKVYLSPRLDRLFSLAQEEAERLRDEYLSTEHFLLASTESSVEMAAAKMPAITSPENPGGRTSTNVSGRT